MNLDITIRKATLDDLPALRDLYLALEEDGVRYQPEHFVIGERTDEFFQSIFDSDTQDILVADIGGEAVRKREGRGLHPYAGIPRKCGWHALL